MISLLFSCSIRAKTSLTFVYSYTTCKSECGIFHDTSLFLPVSIGVCYVTAYVSQEEVVATSGTAGLHVTYQLCLEA